METGLENIRYPAFCFYSSYTRLGGKGVSCYMYTRRFIGNGVLGCISAEYIDLDGMLRNTNGEA